MPQSRQRLSSRTLRRQNSTPACPGMKERTVVLRFMLTLALILTGALAAAEDPGPALWRGLKQAPPAAGVNPERQKALRALDKWLAAADSETDPAVVAYYQRAVDHVLDQLEDEPVAAGVRVFQLYSSSAVVQTPETVFAFDLDQGPNRSLSKPPEEEGVPLRMTDAQVSRLAELVEVSFHTHEHNDHVDYELVRALAAAGKTVVVTESNRERWTDQPWSGKLTVLEQTLEKPHTLGPLKVDVLHDFQWDDKAHTSGTPCNAYLVTTRDGVGVLTKGDINSGTDLYAWLEKMTARGRRVDLVLGTPLFWRGPDLTREIDALLEPVWCVGHVWEFTHRKSGERGGATGTYAMNVFSLRRQVRAGAALVLSWGEHFDFAPAAAAQ